MGLSQSKMFLFIPKTHKLKQKIQFGPELSLARQNVSILYNPKLKIDEKLSAWPSNYLSQSKKFLFNPKA
jgi:hypothetical protein